MIGKVADKDTILLEVFEQAFRYFKTKFAVNRFWFGKKKVAPTLEGFPFEGA